MKQQRLGKNALIGGFLGAAFIVAALVISASLTAQETPTQDKQMSNSKAPVLVELFTSEGCSSCPPADRLLAKLHKDSPDLIVLSEHVTYWNDIGWKDPFSSEESTRRQSDYVQKLRLNSSYTPQMVVNGHYEFVGSDAGAASAALQRASSENSVAIHVSDLQANQQHVTFDVETGSVPKDAELIVVLAQNEGSEYVANGENGGRTLRHVQIARSFNRIANVKPQSAYKGSVSVDVPSPISGSGWHVVVFLQQGEGGRILGAASQPV